MNKLTKGALAMVLAGSVTFAVTNTLFPEQSSKILEKANVLANSGVQKIADDINLPEKKVKTKDLKNVQNTLSPNSTVHQVAIKTVNKSEIAKASIEQNTKTFFQRTTTNSANADIITATKPTATPMPRRSTKPLKTTTTTKTTTTETNTISPSTTNATTTTTTHGQQVSQTVKEKAASRHDKKENNGKKI